jgi:AcrR family transcriptional regulator
MAPLSREQILAAAAKLYAEHGFRGTTTRAIAEAAGVNEVTLFRIFGSKESLIVEAMRAHSVPVHVGTLPEVPVDPEAELAAWATQTRKVLVSMRAMLRQSMSDADENPEMHRCASRGADAAFGSLHHYLDRVRDAGFLAEDSETYAAGAMLIGALFHDAMSREYLPHLFLPAATAPGTYARLCLQSLGYNRAAQSSQRRAS